MREETNIQLPSVTNPLSLSPQRFDFASGRTLEQALKELHQIATDLNATPATVYGKMTFSYVVVDESLIKFHYQQRTRFNFLIEAQGMVEQIDAQTTSISGSANIPPTTLNRLIFYLIALLLIPLVVLAGMVLSRQLSVLLQFIAILAWLIGAGVLTANLLFIRQDLMIRIVQQLR